MPPPSRDSTRGLGRRNCHAWDRGGRNLPNQVVVNQEHAVSDKVGVEAVEQHVIGQALALLLHAVHLQLTVGRVQPLPRFKLLRHPPQQHKMVAIAPIWPPILRDEASVACRCPGRRRPFLQRRTPRTGEAILQSLG